MAVTRLVKVRFREGYGDVVREVAAKARKVFPRLPGVTGFRAGVQADDDEYLLLLVDFESLEDVETYRTHDDHVAFVAEELKPRMLALEAENYIVD